MLLEVGLQFSGRNTERRMKIYRTAKGLVVEDLGRHYISTSISLDSLLIRDDAEEHLKASLVKWTAAEADVLTELRAPIGDHEVWGAGVTYYRSRVARMAESKDGGNFYDRVYEADRPEIFFKAMPYRVVGPNQKVAIRDDSKWSVPEPEVALVITPKGKVVGYTIANDMSSRDIEGQNPLYLPQAKSYDGSCALGPAVLLTSQPLPKSTEIKMEIFRGGKTAFLGSTTLSERKRTAEELISYLFRHCSFPNGCVLMSGTGIVPEESFTLHHGDEIHISIAGLGELINTVA
jgi:2-dehydro-3-deoxy-D-arabinonate dehydratase